MQPADIAVQPDEGIDLTFGAKSRRRRVTLRRPTSASATATPTPTLRSPRPTKRLIQDAVGGDAHLFMRKRRDRNGLGDHDPFIAAVESGP